MIAFDLGWFQATAARKPRNIAAGPCVVCAFAVVVAWLGVAGCARS
jgi:hypothetical protein